MTTPKPPRPRTERPNTVAGLIAKRDELVKLRKTLEQDLRSVTCDLDHLDAAIRLFDVETTPDAIKRYARKHRAKKGTVRRFILTALREGTEPVTSRQLTVQWCEERGLKSDDATFLIIRNRLGACLNNMQQQGITTGAGVADGYKRWRLA